MTGTRKLLSPGQSAIQKHLSSDEKETCKRQVGDQKLGLAPLGFTPNLSINPPLQFFAP